MTETPTSPAAPTPPPPHTPRRLLRSRDDRALAGVCGGLARYFDIDPLIVRIAAVALAFVGGAAVIAYIAAVLLVPEDDGTGHPAPGRPSRAGTVAGVVLIVLAAGALLSNGIGWWWWGPAVPVIAVAGAAVYAGYQLLQRREGRGPRDGRGPGEGGGASRVFGAVLLGLGGLIAASVAAAGAAWATAAGGGEAVAALVIALGVAMVVLSLAHRPATWLVIPALVLAVPAGVVAAADVSLDGGVGQRTYRPATVQDLRATGYELGAGDLVVDLRDLEWPRDRPVPLRLQVGMGHALVVVPDDVCVAARTDVGAGYAGILGEEDGGADMDEQHGSTRRAPGPALLLDAQMGLGAVEVLHRDDRRRFDRGRADAISAELADAGCAGSRA